MKNGHATDETIQEFTWSPELLPATEKDHISACEYCTSRVANYKLLFNEVEQLPDPAFNFDLSGLVLNQLSKQAATRNFPIEAILLQKHETGVSAVNSRKVWPWIVIIFMATGLIGTPLYLFKDSLQNLVAGASLMVTYLIIISVLLIAGFLVFEEYRKYSHRINSLDI